jgi:hypothetical protein
MTDLTHPDVRPTPTVPDAKRRYLSINANSLDRPMSQERFPYEIKVPILIFTRH